MAHRVGIRLSKGHDLLLQSEGLEELASVLRGIVRRMGNEGALRARPIDLSLILEKLGVEGFDADLEFDQGHELDFHLTSDVELRNYQKECLETWNQQDQRGIVVLPTGAGKTIVGILAMRDVGRSTLIVTPTLTLVQQWIDVLKASTSIGDEQIGHLSTADPHPELCSVTVTTYASLRNMYLRFRDKFGLIVLDECHHSLGKFTARALEGLPTTKRLGLTATLPHENEGRQLQMLIGSAISPTTVDELSRKGFLSQYSIKTIHTPFDFEEAQEYNRLREIYNSYMDKARKRFRTSDFQRTLIFQANRDPEAKAALIAHRKSRHLVFQNRTKIEALRDLLIRHRDDKVLVFSESNSTVYLISQEFLIPFITHETKGAERKHVLGTFMEGAREKLVTGRVLDEGFDCGDVSVGIMMSGSSVERQYVQRLGRVLRVSEHKEQALLYELVTPQTFEPTHSKVRRRGVGK